MEPKPSRRGVDICTLGSPNWRIGGFSRLFDGYGALLDGFRRLPWLLTSRGRGGSTDIRVAFPKFVEVEMSGRDLFIGRDIVNRGRYLVACIFAVLNEKELVGAEVGRLKCPGRLIKDVGGCLLKWRRRAGGFSGLVRGGCGVLDSVL